MESWRCDSCKQETGVAPKRVEKCLHHHCLGCMTTMRTERRLHGGKLKKHCKCLVCHNFGIMIDMPPSLPGLGQYQDWTGDRQEYVIKKSSSNPTTFPLSLGENRQTYDEIGKDNSLPQKKSPHRVQHEQHPHRKDETAFSQRGEVIQDNRYEQCRIKGLQNRKLNCAINVIVQVLAQTEGFCQAVLDNCGKSGERNDLAHLLLDVILNIDSEPGPISTEDLQDKIIKREGDFFFWKQHDCHSFLLCLLEALREDLGKDSMELFTGQIQNRFECRNCTHCDCSEPQDFTSLCVPLTQKSVEKGVQLLFQKERLVDSNMLCRSCDKKGRTGYLCTKELLLKQAPRILILQLARSKEVRSKNGLVTIGKHQSLVPYSEELELYPSDKSSVRYRLYAIISHLGTIEGGHYVSYVRPRQSQTDLSSRNQKEKRDRQLDRSRTWYHCTDSIVTRLNPDSGYPNAEGFNRET